MCPYGFFYFTDVKICFNQPTDTDLRIALQRCIDQARAAEIQDGDDMPSIAGWW